MFQSALTNNHLTQERVINKLKNKLTNIGDIIVNKHRFGIIKKVDYFNAIKAKNDLIIVENINNTDYLSHYFNTTDVTAVLNQIGN